MRKQRTKEELEELEKKMLDPSQWVPLTEEQYEQLFQANAQVDTRDLSRCRPTPCSANTTSHSSSESESGSIGE